MSINLSHQIIGWIHQIMHKTILQGASESPFFADIEILHVQPWIFWMDEDPSKPILISVVLYMRFDYQWFARLEYKDTSILDEFSSNITTDGAIPFWQ